VREIDREFFKSFAAEGYDVYLYDQPGGGFSDTIPLSETTMNRSIEDIDLIRKKIGVEKIVLIGQSFGGNICSTYVSKYPDKVKSIIFTAPGELRAKSLLELNKEKKALESSDIVFATEKVEKFEPNISQGVRFVTAVLMSKYGGRNAVENLVSQKEMTEYSTRALPEAIGMAYHVKYADRVPVIKSGGINVLLNATLNDEYKKIAWRVIENLKNVEIPVLVLRTEYDYVEWEATKYYNTLFKNSYLVYISESGHIPWSINVDDTYNSMLYFLKEEYGELDIYKGSKNPRLDK
jgi:proline iminopeptidase